ncbi:MAG TPA: hypothetical protein VHJ78_02315 [Actinomycetota bacterium]|nr:hypothetical protein [Actinomycetota bacterium]
MVLVLLLLSGCTAPGSIVRRPDVAERLAAFLDERVDRLARKDVQGFLGSASQQAQKIERPIAIGAVAVPVTGLAFRPNQRSLRQREETLQGIHVDLVYHYEGLPADNAFRIPLVYDFAEVDGAWTVVNAAVRPGGSLPVWASGPIQSRQSEHFLALFRPELNDPDRILREAEQARAQLDGKITFPLEARYVLLLARDDAEYRTMSSATLGPVSAIAQVETSYEVTPDTIRVLSRQMVINSQKLHQDGTALETLRHELGHLAVAQYTRPFTPAWVSESAAMFLAGTRPESIWRNGLRRNRFEGITIERLTRAANLGEHESSREGASLEYAYSAAAAWYLVENFGAERYWEFYRAYAAVPAGDPYNRLPENSSAPQGEQAIEALAVATTGAALQRVFALDPVGLDRAIREWMAAQVA